MGTWRPYVERHTKGLTQAEVAERTGLGQTAISRWLREDTNAPRAEYVVAFARGFNLNPVEALIVAGYVTADEAGTATEGRTPIADYPDMELLEELRQRFHTRKPVTDLTEAELVGELSRRVGLNGPQGRR